MGRVSVAKLLLLVSALAVAALVLLGGSPAAEAQISCDDQATGWEVSAADEFNDAVACHNNAADPNATSNIILLNDIGAETLEGEAVFAPIRGGNLIIIGEGHTLRRGPNAPADAVPVLKFEVSRVTLIGTIDLAIEVGPNDTAGIEHVGPSVLRVVTTAISPGAAGSSATGIVSSHTSFDGTVQLVASSIEGVPIGMQIDRVAFNVEASTIASTSVDISSGGDNGDIGFRRIVNSTLGGPTGIRIDGGGVDVDNSTILGDGAATSAATTANDVVSFRSSIVNICSADTADSLANPPTPGWTDRGFNVGSCFDGGSNVDLTLADNGCRRSTPIGCPKTAAISALSPARDAGLCRSGEPYEGDQRGFPRNPQAVGCDAGSFEDGCPITLNRQFEVSNAVEFNQAVICHNFADDRTDITLLNDIAAQSVDGAAVFPVIEKDYLVILGNGHSLSRASSAGSQPAPLLSVESPDGPNERFWALELGLEVGPADTHGILHRGSMPLLLQALSIYPGPDGSAATGIESSDNPGYFELTFSSIEGLPVGLRLQTDSARIVMGLSTIASTGIDIDVIEAPTFYIDASTLGGPTGIQMTSGSARIGASTILGDGAVLSAAADGDAFVAFKSTIVNACSADQLVTDDQPGPGWVDLGSNVGSCFGAPAETEALADNGCRYLTATGCPRTAALPLNSAARGAGDCNDQVSTDQRGELRTPIGPGCDAGAFEAGTCEGYSSQVFTVGTHARLDAAIICFNSGLLGPGDYEITLTNDITITDERFSQPANTIAVDQPNPGYSLLINGDGHIITGPAPVGIGANPADTIINVAPSNLAPIEFRDLGFDTPFDAVSTRQFVWNQSPASLTIRTSAFENRTDFSTTGIRSSGGGALDVFDSWFDSPIAIDVQGAGAIVSIAGSAFLTNGLDVASALSLPDGEVEIVNSTFDNTWVTLGTDVTGNVKNSTFRGPGIVGDATIDVASSIINECGANAVDAGSNVGQCFGAAVELARSVSVNCDTPTPVDCAPVIRLGPFSPALGAGDCTGVPFDQNGTPRTPAGPGCDAGAFERRPSRTGDVNDDGMADNADVQALLVWLAGGPAPVALLAGDVTDDGLVKLDDALAIAQLIAD